MTSNYLRERSQPPRLFLHNSNVQWAITGSFTAVELLGGLLRSSVALMSDAGHMLTDALALGLSPGALRIANRPRDEKKAFGLLRAEILAALVNGTTHSVFRSTIVAI